MSVGEMNKGGFRAEIQPYDAATGLNSEAFGDFYPERQHTHQSNDLQQDAGGGVWGGGA